MLHKKTSGQLLFSTTRIEVECDGGRVGCGTGFAFMYYLGEDKYAFLVTNRHVIERAIRGRFSLHRTSGTGPKIGESLTFELDDFESRWHTHPDPRIDVAAMPLGELVDQACRGGSPVYVVSLQPELIPTPEQIADAEAVEEVVFVGYPDGIYDRVNLTPVVRKGITATPIAIDYCGQPAFLVDAAVFGGSSGSPVFLYSRAVYEDKGQVHFGSRVAFLGLIASVHVRKEMAEVLTLSAAAWQGVKLDKELNLGIVYKARTVVETIESFLRMRGVLGPKSTDDLIPGGSADLSGFVITTSTSADGDPDGDDQVALEGAGGPQGRSGLGAAAPGGFGEDHDVDL